MNLSPNHTYLFLDFETTGLDLASDFPIQIALIQTNHHLQVLKTYTSYILLPESIKKLRSNVSYMTGIDIETIESQGQSIETIQSDIVDFFGPDTVLIGQNISFDIGFLKKFFPGCTFAHSIDTYPLAASSIPYLKSYSLESIDHHLTEKYDSYKDQKSYLLSTLSEGKALSAHDALYDCISGVCFIGRWYNQIEKFKEQFPILGDVLSKTQGEGITHVIARNEAIHTKGQSQDMDRHASLAMTLPILVSPLSESKSSHHDTIINREKVPQHSKRSTRGVNLKTLISELPHPCIIAVSHGSKIDIIKRACHDESFDFFKEEQIIDQKKLSLWLYKPSYTEEERLFVVFYLSHYRDGYRVLHPTLTVHRYILDYLQTKKIELKKDKKILCTHGGLYYTIQNNPNRKEVYKDYPICILDADRRHTTYNDYAQRGITLSTLLSQREKFDYATKQNHETITSGEYDSIEKIITHITFFIAHFIKESEYMYQSNKQYKRELNYISSDSSYVSSMRSRSELRSLRTTDLQAHIREQQKSLYDLMEKINIMFHNPLKIQRNTNQNKDIRYSIAPAVRYIDFAEYLKMFGEHRLFFFSSARSEYTKFISTEGAIHNIYMVREDKNEAIEKIIKETEGSVFIISHNSEKSKKIFNDLHNSPFKNSHTLIGEYLTGGVAKNSIKSNNNKPSIIIGGYHMLLHFRGEGHRVDKIIIVYVPNSMNNFIEQDILQYAPII